MSAELTAAASMAGKTLCLPNVDVQTPKANDISS
jgi:hypothetical protein